MFSLLACSSSSLFYSFFRIFSFRTWNFSLAHDNVPGIISSNYFFIRFTIRYKFISFFLETFLIYVADMEHQIRERFDKKKMRLIHDVYEELCVFFATDNL